MNEKNYLSYTELLRLRANFGKHKEKLKIPHLYNVQLKSYEKFIGKINTTTNDLKESRLEYIFKSIFPVYSHNKSMKLEYIQYKLGNSIYTADECKMKGLTYASPLKIRVHLCHNNKIKNKVDPFKSIIQDIYIVNMPLMTEKGTFVINGTERVVVSQLHKSPGLFFEIDKS